MKIKILMVALSKIVFGIFVIFIISIMSKSFKEPDKDLVPRFLIMEIEELQSEIKESYSASIRGRQDIEIYPQISGIISSLCVHEGQKVRKGDVLFILNQTSYQAALRTASANVYAAEAQVKTAKLDYTSKQRLFEEEVISEYELQTAYNTLTIALAAVEQAKAEEINAQNSLSYTVIKSPSDGIVGVLPYRIGALVSQAMTQPLTTISDNTQMGVYFSMTEDQLRMFVKEYGSLNETIKKMPSLQLQLSDGTIYDAKGTIETISGVINSQTGTVSVRALFPNEKQLLWSGGIGNVIITHQEDKAIVIPQNVTVELQDRRYVYKIIDGKAVQTFISVERLNDGNNFIVRKGIQKGDIIICEGVSLARNGMSISTNE